MSTDSVTLLSAGPLLFAPDVSPDGTTVLFVADVSAATVYAFEVAAETWTRPTYLTLASAEIQEGGAVWLRYKK